MAGHGRGGKGRAGDFFNLAKPTADPPTGAEEVTPALGRLPALPPPPPPPRPGPAPPAAGGSPAEEPTRAAEQQAGGPSRTPMLRSSSTAPRPPGKGDTAPTTVQPISGGGPTRRPLLDPVAMAAASPPASPRADRAPAMQVRLDKEAGVTSQHVTQPLRALSETAEPPAAQPEEEPLVDAADPEFGERTEKNSPTRLPGAPRASPAAPPREPEAPRPVKLAALAPPPDARRKAPPPPPPPPPKGPEPTPAPRPSSSAQAAGRSAPVDPQLVAKYEKMKPRIEEVPDDADLRMRFASLCADMGKTDEALNHFKVAARLQPQNGFIKVRLKELGGEEIVTQLMEDSSRGPFVSALGEFLVYPFQGVGLGILVIGAVFFGIANLLRQYGGILLNVAVFGYMASYQFKIVQLSAQGKKEPPDWPDFNDALGDTLRMIGCYLASYGPAIAFSIFAVMSLNANDIMPGFIAGGGPGVAGPGGFHSFGGSGGRATSPEMRVFEESLVAEGYPPEQAHMMALEEFGGAPGPGPRGPFGPTEPSAAPAARGSGFRWPIVPILWSFLAFLAFVAGTFYLPLALLMTAIFNSSLPAFQYGFGLESARRIWSDYLICAGVVVGGFTALGVVSITSNALINLILGWVPIIGPLIGHIISTGVALYGTLAMYHLVGRLYYHNEKKIQWL